MKVMSMLNRLATLVPISLLFVVPVGADDTSDSNSFVISKVLECIAQDRELDGLTTAGTCLRDMQVRSSKSNRSCSFGRSSIAFPRHGRMHVDIDQACVCVEVSDLTEELGRPQKQIVGFVDNEKAVSHTGSVFGIVYDSPKGSKFKSAFYFFYEQCLSLIELIDRN